MPLETPEVWEIKDTFKGLKACLIFTSVLSLFLYTYIVMSFALQAKADAQRDHLKSILAPVFDLSEGFALTSISESFERGYIYGCSNCFSLRHRVIASIPNKEVDLFMTKVNDSLKASNVTVGGDELGGLKATIRKFPVSSGEPWPLLTEFRQENVSSGHTLIYIQIDDTNSGKVFPWEYID